VRGTLSPSEGPTASIDFTNKARLVMASFPEVTQVVSRREGPTMAPTPRASSTPSTCRPEAEGSVGPIFNQDKERLIASMDRSCQNPE